MPHLPPHELARFLLLVFPFFAMYLIGYMAGYGWRLFDEGGRMTCRECGWNEQVVYYVQWCPECSSTAIEEEVEDDAEDD